MTDITDHLAEIERRVDIALARADRVGDEVTIVAVSKMQSADSVRAAAAAGLRHFGENYLQEGLDKITAVADPALVWHFVGRVQANKTRPIAERFDWVETVDRLRIARRLSEQRPASLPPLKILLQLNTDAEAHKAGIPPGELEPLARAVAELPRLELRGLMCIPPAAQSAAKRRASFLAVRDAARRLVAAGLPVDTLSMGMSADYELAIECGATSVRIGTALFGERRAADA